MLDALTEAHIILWATNQGNSDGSFRLQVNQSHALYNQLAHFVQKKTWHIRIQRGSPEKKNTNNVVMAICTLLLGSGWEWRLNPKLKQTEYKHILRPSPVQTWRPPASPRVTSLFPRCECKQTHLVCHICTAVGFQSGRVLTAGLHRLGYNSCNNTMNRVQIGFLALPAVYSIFRPSDEWL